MAGLGISTARDNTPSAAANRRAAPLAPQPPKLLRTAKGLPNGGRTAEIHDQIMTVKLKPISGQEEFFWKTKTLEQMSNAEWESLCDGCARCCLQKLEDEDDGKIYFTHVSCRLLDAGLCACKDYAHRSEQVADCVRLTPANVRTLNWLPPSCGYRLVAEGRDLYWWHPLISGDPNTVHEAGVSVRGRVRGSENEIADADLEDHIVQWPERLPKRARLKKRPKS
jgi:uncharacterized cysteine cluster protein YcgN (CxxCxxCC family)